MRNRAIASFYLNVDSATKENIIRTSKTYEEDDGYATHAGRTTAR